MTADQNGFLRDAPLARDWFAVTMSDTDAAQVIFAGAPIRWTERMVTFWLAEVHCPLSRMLACGNGMPAVHVELDYRSPLRLDDQITGTLWLDRVSERSVIFRGDFTTGDGVAAVSTRMTQVYIDSSDGRPQAAPWPAELMTAFATTDPVDIAQRMRE